MIKIPDAAPRFRLLTDEQCDFVHRASLELLRRTGVRLHHPEAVSLLRETDSVIQDDGLALLPANLVEWALKQAPSRITLCRRGTSAPAVRLEGREVHFGTGSDCANYLDPRTGVHRPFTTREIADCVRLVDALPGIDFCMSMGTPSDVEEHARFRTQFALMMTHTAKPIVFVADNRADCEAIHAMAAAAAGGESDLRLNPTLLSYSQMTTPLVQPGDSLEKLLFTAEKAIPVVHQPAPMMGGTAPVTMAGTLVLGNAEVLSSIVIHQLKRPGAPFVYGSGQHPMDMRTSISVYNAPEWLLARAAVADMARHYGLPHFGYAGHTDSIIMDEQAASDATSTIMLAFMTGEHLAHDVGYMESGLTTSPELIVFSDEVIGMMRSFNDGFSFDPESLALDLIHQLGPGGNFMTTDHTYRHFRKLWLPTLFNRDRKNRWLAKGGTTMGRRLKDKTVAIMESHRPEPLSESVRAEVEYILNSR
ncbi:MAG: trimethylamine methyltransferase family protein [Desulfobacterales bacterium]